MSVLCSLQDNRILPLNSIVCVHHVAVRGEAVNSNGSSAGGWIPENFYLTILLICIMMISSAINTRGR